MTLPALRTAGQTLSPPRQEDGGEFGPRPPREKRTEQRTAGAGRAGPSSPRGGGRRHCEGGESERTGSPLTTLHRRRFPLAVTAPRTDRELGALPPSNGRGPRPGGNAGGRLPLRSCARPSLVDPTRKVPGRSLAVTVLAARARGTSRDRAPRKQSTGASHWSRAGGFGDLSPRRPFQRGPDNGSRRRSASPAFAMEEPRATRMRTPSLPGTLSPVTRDADGMRARKEANDARASPEDEDGRSPGEGGGEVHRRREKIADIEERIAGSYHSSDSDGGPKFCPHDAWRRGRPRPWKEMSVSSQANMSNFRSRFFKGRSHGKSTAGQPRTSVELEFGRGPKFCPLDKGDA
ncbi:hypothetical protein THAOC_25902 [Thalassiosira oceanica]|uniref:Uncharacterized protein n=1 Tax=Thalassiosira oceanica TaxID=159749 RepID=K0S6G0_THAOC|nr:hypothetical protein THAOC_25902 [Thalassiosira oceanica]|eukprot:EJK54467.1 hypothetical protein THAOC_25902 [Thalassiosira oceanica]